MSKLSFLNCVNSETFAPFAKFNNYMAKHYKGDMGKVLIHTGVIGWVLSAMAQVAAIVTNDKITPKEKMYLIPQELADAAVNIISFYVFSQTCKSAITKGLRCGKILRKSIREHLELNKIPNVGKNTFDVMRDGKLTPGLKEDYQNFYNGVSFTATTAGSVLSCNIVTPIIRNEIATHKQKKHMTKYSQYLDTENPVIQQNYLPRPTMQAFQAQAALKI